mgnify:CR=1 FL=1
MHRSIAKRLSTLHCIHLRHHRPLVMHNHHHRTLHIIHNELTSVQDKQDLQHVHEQVEKSVQLALRTHNKSKPSDLTVTCCMSGGIDSTVMTLLLQEVGVRVRALFMSNWDARGEESSASEAQDMCESVRLDWQDVKTVCTQYRIPHFHETLLSGHSDSTMSNVGGSGSVTLCW